MRSTFWPNGVCERQTSQYRHTGLKLSLKRENSALSMKNWRKRSFQVMRRTFWPNQICERQSSQNSHTGLKFSPKRENGALFMKIVQKPFFRSCAAPFWPNRVCERQSWQTRHTGLKFSPKRENSALFMKIVQNPFFGSCAARFGQIAFLTVKVLKIVKLAPKSLRNGKAVRFPWKLDKTLFSGHAQHVLAKSNLWASNFSKSLHLSQILFKTGKQCAILENCTKRSFQVMRSTFWRNRIREGESCQNRHTGLKFSPKRANSALFIKNCTSCAARFGKIAFLSTKVVNSSHWPEILFKTAKQCAFHENCTKRSFQVMRSTFWPNHICERQSCQNRHTGLKFSPKKENSALFMKIVQNPFFRSCAAPFRPNRIFERQSCQNRHTGLKFSSKRENSALSMKIVQNALFRSSAARFGQIEFVSVKVVKIVTLAWNSLKKGKTVRFSWKLYKTPFFRSCAARFGQTAFLSVKVLKIVKLASKSLQNGKTVRFPWKLYKTLFWGHAQYVLAKSHFWASKFSKSSHWREILFKTGKQCAFHENCTKRSFQVMRSTFWPNRIFERKSSQNRQTGPKLSSKRENSALSMKIVQNALFRSCSARFGQIAFLTVKVLKIVKLASKSLRNGKAVRFPWKLDKTLFSGHAQHVLAKSHFWASKFSK